MPTDAAFVDHVLDQIHGAGVVAVRKMFGAYGVYCDGKVVGLICHNQFFLKPLPEALALMGAPVYAPPYPGARPHLLLAEELDAPDRVARFLRAFAEALPAPKPKKPKAAKKV